MSGVKFPMLSDVGGIRVNKQFTTALMFSYLNVHLVLRSIWNYAESAEINGLISIEDIHSLVI